MSATPLLDGRRLGGRRRFCGGLLLGRRHRLRGTRAGTVAARAREPPSAAALAAETAPAGAAATTRSTAAARPAAARPARPLLFAPWLADRRLGRPQLDRAGDRLAPTASRLDVRLFHFGEALQGGLGDVD